MIWINLKEYESEKTSALVGFEKGEQVRKEKLPKGWNKVDKVLVKFPDSISSVSSSFWLG